MKAAPLGYQAQQSTVNRNSWDGRSVIAEFGMLFTLQSAYAAGQAIRPAAWARREQVGPAQVHAAQHQRRADMPLIPVALFPVKLLQQACQLQRSKPIKAEMPGERVARLNRWDFSMVIAVTTRDSRSVAYLCSSSAEDTMPAAQTRAGVKHKLDHNTSAGLPDSTQVAPGARARRRKACL